MVYVVPLCAGLRYTAPTLDLFWLNGCVASVLARWKSVHGWLAWKMWAGRPQGSAIPSGLPTMMCGPWWASPPCQAQRTGMKQGLT